MLFYTAAEVAERWKVSATFVRRLIDNGELSATRLGGKLLRVPQDDLEAYERSHRTTAHISADPIDATSVRAALKKASRLSAFKVNR